MLASGPFTLPCFLLGVVINILSKLKFSDGLARYVALPKLAMLLCFLMPLLAGTVMIRGLRGLLLLAIVCGPPFTLSCSTLLGVVINDLS